MIDSTNPMKEVPEVAFLKKEKKRLVFRLDKSASEIVELLSIRGLRTISNIHLRKIQVHIHLPLRRYHTSLASIVL